MLLRTIFIACLGFAALDASRPAAAQPAPAGPEPQIVTMLSSADEVYKAIDVAMGLTNPVDQEQTKVIKDYLDVFLIGMDLDRPIEMDLLVDQKPYRYRSGFPVPSADLIRFRQRNLIPLGIQNRRVAQTSYRLSGKVFEGWMRFDDNGTRQSGADDYAWISSEQDDFGNSPNYMDLPADRLAALLQKGYLVGGELTNAPQGVAERWQMIQKPDGMHAQGMERIKPRENEDPADFKLRKILSEHRLEELEQYIAEAQHAMIGGTVDPMAQEATIALALTPIPETDLASSVEQIGKTPSRFAAVPRSEKPVTTLRINYPLDQLRKDNLTEALAVLLERRHAKIDASTTQTDDQKAAAKKAAEILSGVLKDTIQNEGRIDAFVEIWPSEAGTHTMLMGLRAADGTKLEEALTLLPEAHDGQKVEMNVDKAGEVAIHSLFLSEQDNPAFGDFFGSYKGFVGTSADSVWFAIGENALDELKGAIEKTAAPSQPGPSDLVFVDLDTRLGPLMELAEDPHEEEQPGQFAKYQDIAKAAFATGDDRLLVRMEKAEMGGVSGEAKATAGVLRFIGQAAAEFSRDNLDEEGKPKEQAAAGP